MAKKTLSTDEQIAAHFRALADLYAGRESQVEDSDVEEDDEEEELEALVREEVESLGIKELRALAAEYLEDAPKTKADILAALEEFYDEEEEDEDEDDEEDDEEDEDDEADDDEYDRDDLEEMTLAQVRKVAKEAGYDASETKGKDKDELIDLILGEDDEDDEDEEDDEDDDVEELDEDALAAMSHKELVTLAKELEIKVPKTLTKSTKANQKKLVELILDSGDDE